MDDRVFKVKALLDEMVGPDIWVILEIDQAGLLMSEILVGVNVLLPSLDAPIKALTRVGWIESFVKGSDKCAMGLKFKEISKENQDEILKYIIKAQITH